jgi:hypothetical protein
MIGSSSAQTPIVAIGHGQTTGRSWPPGWEQIGDQLRERVKKRLGDSIVAYSVSGDARRIAWDFGAPPEEVTVEDWAKSQARWLDDKKRYRVALSYLSLHLASQGIWPKEFVPAWTSTDLILDAIVPEWQSFIRRLMEEWTRTGVTYQIRLRWRRALVCFLWQSDLPTSGTLDLTSLTRQWGQFLNNPPAWLESAAAIQNRTGLRRAMLGMVNMFITDGRLGGEKSPYAAVQTPFWLPISEDVRAAAHRVLPGGAHVNKNDLRGPLARYVLMHCLGFCSARPRNDSAVNEREWGEARDRLTAEHFSHQAVETAIVNTRQIVELATKMKEVVS